MDALLYGCSALFAGLTAATAEIPLQRSWGRVTVWPYALAAVTALIAVPGSPESEPQQRPSPNDPRRRRLRRGRDRTDGSGREPCEPAVTPARTRNPR